MKTTLERVLACFALAADVRPDELCAETKLRGGALEIDSLDLAEFYMTVEEEFDVELPDRECACFTTIGDVATRVDELRI